MTAARLASVLMATLAAAGLAGVVTNWPADARQRVGDRR